MEKDSINLYLIDNEPFIYRSINNTHADFARNREVFFNYLRIANPLFSAPFLGVCNDCVILSEDQDLTKDVERIMPSLMPSIIGGTEYMFKGKEFMITDIVKLFRENYDCFGKNYNINDIVSFNYFYTDHLSYELKNNFDVKKYYLGYIEL